VSRPTPSECFDPYAAAEHVLMMADAHAKAHAAIDLFAQWQSNSDDNPPIASNASVSKVRVLAAPGRPTRPELVAPQDLPRRGLGSKAGRIALLHSLAHIEFNAINLAVDAVYRFRDMPNAYIHDWLKVAADEGTHFLLLENRLQSLGVHYGAMSAHDGLWDMARRTDHDVLVRMALVPRILEARGLDVAPPMIERLTQQRDHASAAILQRIYTDEITHVAIGNRWFRYVCESRGLDGAEVFRDLLRGSASGYLRRPFNDSARLEAGFTIEEMQIIREMEADYHG